MDTSAVNLLPSQTEIKWKKQCWKIFIIEKKGNMIHWQTFVLFKNNSLVLTFLKDFHGSENTSHRFKLTLLFIHCIRKSLEKKKNKKKERIMENLKQNINVKPGVSCYQIRIKTEHMSTVPHHQKKVPCRPFEASNYHQDLASHIPLCV